MNPFKRFSEVTEDWKFLTLRDGVKTAFPVISREIAQLPYRHLRFHIISRPLTEPFPQNKPRIALEIVPFQQSHLELVRMFHRPSEAYLCARRLNRGQFGLIAFHQNFPAGYAWVSSPLDWDLERVQFQLDLKDILCTDVYTTPDMRGKGVQTALTLARFQEFRNMGYQRAICYIEVNNKPSLAVWLRKFNAQIGGNIDFLRVGPWYWVKSTWRANP